MDIKNTHQNKNTINDEIESIGNIIEQKMSKIADLLKNNNDNIRDVLQKADRQIEEFNKSLEETTQNREILKAIKPSIERRSQEAKKTIVMNFLFGSMPMPDDSTKTSAAEILFFAVLLKKSYEEIYTLAETKNIQSNKERIIEYFRRVIEIKYEKTKDQFIVKEDFLKKLQHELREQFPLLGNNKFIQISSIKTQEKIRKYFATEGIQQMREQIVTILEEEFDTFDTLDDIAFCTTQRIDEIFQKEVKKIYERFAEKYITEELEIASKRKEAMQVKNNKKKIPNSNWRSDIIKMMQQEKEIIKEEELFLEELFKNRSKKQEIIKYIHRLYRNKKNIRIMDLQEKFGIQEEAFTDEIITNAMKLGIIFYKNKKDSLKEKERKPIQKTSRNELGPIYEKSEKEELQDQINDYIDKKDGCTIDDSLHILNLAGYELENKPSFIKGCQKLYKNTKEINNFVRELKDEILKINERINASNKKNYWSIELGDNKRILFLEKNIIDGIYSHNDYMRRLNNQK